MEGEAEEAKDQEWEPERRCREILQKHSQWYGVGEPESQTILLWFQYNNRCCTLPPLILEKAQI